MGRTLVVSEQGTEVSVQGDSLVLSLAGKEARRVPLVDLEQAILMGSVEMTSGARRALLRRGVDVVFLSAAGRYVGRMIGPISGNAALRMAQVRRLDDEPARLALSAGIVRAKILNQRRVLMRAQRDGPDEEVSDVAAGLRVSADRAAGCVTLEELRGIEGAAAAAYWKAFGKLVRHPELTFRGRSKRPPLDGPNAMLSFGYTLLGIVQQSHVLAVGLDPYVGVFHEIDHNRPSLALDLIEEFRPVAVDALALTMLNLRQVGAADFERPAKRRAAEAIAAGFEETEECTGEEGGEEGGGVYLAEGGRRVFLRAFFDRLRDALGEGGSEGRRTLREQMRTQVERFAWTLREAGRSYEPFVWR